jgi:ubiquinone/menaquinone biosynthesis C-methylase UbiE
MFSAGCPRNVCHAAWPIFRLPVSIEEEREMSAVEQVYPRGRTSGSYPSLTTRGDEAYVEFVQDARNALLHAQQAPIGAYSRRKLQEAGCSAQPDPASTSAAVELLMKDPALRTYYRVKRSLQEAFWGRLVASFGSRRDALLAALEEAEKIGPGTIECDPQMPVPEYLEHEIHLQPGGYHREPLAGFMYDYGLKVFMGGAADNDMVSNLAARATQLPDDRRVERVLDLGVSAGATTTALRRLHPQAEVWGIDASAAMVRYAHLRAAAQDCDVHFRQMNAEQLRYPDGHFDIVLSMLLFHEVPVDAAKRIIAEVFRVLRPGGVFTVVDFPGDRSRDVYSMFFAEMDSADNGEPFLPGYVRSNIEDHLVEAGFEIRSYEPAAALRTGRVAVKPSTAATAGPRQ